MGHSGDLWLFAALSFQLPNRFDHFPNGMLEKDSGWGLWLILFSRPFCTCKVSYDGQGFRELGQVCKVSRFSGPPPRSPSQP